MTRLVPRKYVLLPACTKGCSLNPANLAIFDIVHGWFEAGQNNATIEKNAATLGVKLSNGSIGRHKGAHLQAVADDHGVAVDPEKPLDKVDHVKVLEQIIARGAAGIGTWKVTPDMTMKAMEMLYKLTQGNAQQAWLDAMAEAIAGVTSDDPSIASDDEVAQAGEPD